MDEAVFIVLYNFEEEDGSITKRMFDFNEPSLEYISVDMLDGIIEVFTN